MSLGSSPILDEEAIRERLSSAHARGKKCSLKAAELRARGNSAYKNKDLEVPKPFPELPTSSLERSRMTQDDVKKNQEGQPT